MATPFPPRMVARQAEPAHLGDDPGGKHGVLVPIPDAGPDAFVDERPDGVAPGELFGRQQGVEAEVVRGQGHAGLQWSGTG
jgi:hypothetical protein